MLNLLANILDMFMMIKKKTLKIKNTVVHYHY